MTEQLNTLEQTKRSKLQREKPLVYDKVLKFNDGMKNGKVFPIMHIQYDYMCNFQCSHCSIKSLQYKPENKIKITPEDVGKLAKQADEMGLARFVITGGEPLVFPDLAKLVKAIDPTKFYINCDTNGWLLDDNKAKYLKSIGIDRMQLSLDSLNEKEHDDFRHKPGSFQRAIKAIDCAVNADMDIFINTVVTKQRLHSDEFVEFIEFLNGKGVGVFVSYAKPVGSWEGNFECLVNRDDMKYMEELEKKYDVYTHLTPAYGRDMGCIAVKGMITVTQYGDVLPCQYIYTSLGNIRDTSLKDLIDTGLSIKYFGEYVDTCLIAEDMEFIHTYIEGKLYGRQLPVDYKEVFTEKDKTEIPFYDHMIKTGRFEL